MPNCTTLEGELNIVTLEWKDIERLAITSTYCQMAVEFERQGISREIALCTALGISAVDHKTAQVLGA